MKPDLRGIVPPTVGRIEGESIGNGAEHVVYLVEAFNNSSSNVNCGRMLADLVRCSEWKHLCLEAHSGDLTGHFRRSWHSLRSSNRNPQADYEAGRLDPLNYAGIVAGDQFEVHGVEEPKLYEVCMRSAKLLLPEHEIWSGRMTTILRELRADALPQLSPRYAAFVESCLNDDDKLPEIEVLMPFAAGCGLAPDGPLNSDSVLETKRREAKIDFEAANREQLQLYQLLAETLTNRERVLVQSFYAAGLQLDRTAPQRLAAMLESGGLDGVGLSTALARTPLGRILHYSTRRARELSTATPEEFLSLFHQTLDEVHTQLQGRAKAQTDSVGEANPFADVLGRHAALVELFQFLLAFLPLFGATPADFPNLTRYVHYLTHFSSLSLFGAVEEIIALRDNVQQRLAVTDKDRIYASLIPRLHLLIASGGLVCLPAHVKTISSRLREFDHATLCAELERFLPDSKHLAEFKALETDFEDRLDETVRYYRLMDLRADAMARETVSAMRNWGVSSCVLLTGGFHRERVTATLSSLGIGYTSILPVITEATSPDQQRAYFQQLKSGGSRRME